MSTPMAKEPNPTLKNNQDWSLVDLENISEDFIPATAYKISKKTQLDIDDSYGRFHIKGEDVPSRSIYRIAWRRMAANTGFRTLYPAIIPPGALHVHPVVSGASTLGNKETVIAGTIMSSLVSDFFLRSMSVSDIHGSVVEKLPIPKDNSLLDEAVFLYLRLNCLTRAWALLWEELQKSRWTSTVPIRTSNSRRRAQDRIDEIVANRLGLTQIDLANIYSTQFPVMRGYDRKADYRPAWILYKRVTC
ncbi:hypothetical protein [Corynebacterium neomassiliense]|uniref:hypothetical protein n=1 Tax=Corynebacterium neomassiliense TaxID=2079482 RepID=UPI00102FCBC2|nr:hypothetical protein [Corynebacterium neomassiliense]